MRQLWQQASSIRFERKTDRHTNYTEASLWCLMWAPKTTRTAIRVSEHLSISSLVFAMNLTTTTVVLFVLGARLCSSDINNAHRRTRTHNVMATDAPKFEGVNKKQSTPKCLCTWFTALEGANVVWISSSKVCSQWFSWSIPVWHVLL